METYNVRNLEINVYTENSDDGCRLEWTDNGVNKVASFSTLYVKGKDRKIFVEYELSVKDNSGNYVNIRPEKKRFHGNAPGEWDYFYTLNTPDNMGTEIYKHIANGISHDIFTPEEKWVSAIRMFDNNGNFYQPIIYDITVNNTISNNDGSIEVNVINSAGNSGTSGDSLEYSLLDKEGNELISYTTDNTFSNLSSGVYKVKIKDTALTESISNEINLK